MGVAAGAVLDGKTSDKKGAGVEEVVEVAGAKAGEGTKPIRAQMSTPKGAERHQPATADVGTPILFAA